VADQVCVRFSFHPLIVPAPSVIFPNIPNGLEAMIVDQLRTMFGFAPRSYEVTMPVDVEPGSYRRIGKIVRSGGTFAVFDVTPWPGESAHAAPDYYRDALVPELRAEIAELRAKLADAHVRGAQGLKP